MGKNADVDQSLFGSAKKNKARAAKSSDGSRGLSRTSDVSGFYSGGGSASSEGRKRRGMQLSATNNTRSTSLRSNRADPGTVVIPWSRYTSICENAVPLSENREAKATMLKTQKMQDILQESEARRREFEELDRARDADGSDLNDLEAEAKARDDEILHHAKVLQEEDEDEVRQLYSSIVQAKCQAVRDAQLREKEELEQALKDEEARLDAEMEAARVAAVEESARKERDLVLKYHKGREALEEQITERQQARLLQEELREQEAQELLQSIEELKLEEEEKLKQQAEKTRQMMAEVGKANEISIRLKEEELARAKEEDLKLAEFLKQKALDEEALEQAKLEAKAERDRTFRQLLAQQERAQETAGKRDEISARRAAEAKERALRKKEAEERAMRHQAGLELNEARRRQIEIQQRQLAMQALQEREDFERTLEAQKDIMKTVREEETVKASRRKQNRNQILQQIRQKEEEAVKARKEFFAEGVKIDEEAKTRRARLDMIKQRKLDELIEQGVDQKYLYSVKRKAAQVTST
eukprot:m.167300 g.167300  ORF g.167300 m.167300 type:complete len:529 (-) comp18194_c0_seq2:157-1743(-)